MKIIDYFASDNREHWLSEIKRSDWGAGRFLYELLRDNRLKELCGESTTVYVFGVSEPIESFTGKVIAVWHRLNDCEDKWIVSVDGAMPDKDEILRSTRFQEQYFMGELYL